MNRYISDLHFGHHHMDERMTTGIWFCIAGLCRFCDGYGKWKRLGRGRRINLR